MPTAVLERKVQTQIPCPEVKVVRTWPELRKPPKDALRVPLIPRAGQKIRMPRGLTCCLAANPPATAWPRIMDAVQDFGLDSLYVYAPEEAFQKAKVDPAIIAEKDGKFYLIVAWE